MFVRAVLPEQLCRVCCALPVLLKRQALAQRHAMSATDASRQYPDEEDGPPLQPMFVSARLVWRSTNSFAF